jgi:hypothetical protein
MVIILLLLLLPGVLTATASSDGIHVVCLLVITPCQGMQVGGLCDLLQVVANAADRSSFGRSSA